MEAVEKRIGRRIRNDTLPLQLAAVFSYYMGASVGKADSTARRLFTDIYNYGATKGTTAQLFGIKGQQVRNTPEHGEYMAAVKKAMDFYVGQFRDAVQRVDMEQKQAEELAVKNAHKIENSERTRAVTTCGKVAEKLQKSCLDAANKKPQRFMFVAVLDSRTTEGCRQKHGMVYQRSEYQEGVTVPPCHWCCRSSIVWVPDDEMV